jgi:type II secretory pathway pseudopilin PulG
MKVFTRSARRSSRSPHRPRLSASPVRRRARCRAFSLLEAILALAILVAALAVIGELVRAGIRNAQMARDLSRAQVLCEHKLSEIFAGAAAAGQASNSAFPESPGWLYSVNQDGSGPQGLIKIRVTVEQDPAQQRYPVKFTLAQWMRDPVVTATQLAPPANATSQTGGTSQTTGSSTGQGR